MPQISNSYIFMSYSRRDTIAMRHIASFLRQQGFKIWVDNEKLTPGTPVWEEEIEKAIQGAFAVIVVLSPDSKSSNWVRREISLADQYERRVFPVLIGGDEKASISLRLMNRQFVDIRENEDEGLSSLKIALLEYLQDPITQNKREGQLPIGGRATIKQSTVSSGKTTSAQHTVLKWTTIGIIGLCVLLYGAWGLISLVKTSLFTQQNSISSPIPTVPSTTPTFQPPVTQTLSSQVTQIVATPQVCINLFGPSNGSDLPPVGKVDFSWERHPDAVSYSLNIISPDGATTSFTTTDNSIRRYMETIPAGGEYKWEVVVVGKNNNTICRTTTSLFYKTGPSTTESIDLICKDENGHVDCVPR